MAFVVHIRILSLLFDHTLPDNNDLPTAYLLGVVIEKHFTHDKTLPGNDHYHAMDVEDLSRFIQRVHSIHELWVQLNLETNRK